MLMESARAIGCTVVSDIGKALRCESLLGIEVDVRVPLPCSCVS